MHVFTLGGLQVTPEQSLALVEYIAHLSVEDWDGIARDLRKLGFVPAGTCAFAPLTACHDFTASRLLAIAPTIVVQMSRHLHVGMSPCCSLCTIVGSVSFIDTQHIMFRAVDCAATDLSQLHLCELTFHMTHCNMLAQFVRFGWQALSI